MKATEQIKGARDTSREADMFNRYTVQGETLQTIADAYGLSRERVRQILKRTPATYASRLAVVGFSDERRVARWASLHPNTIRTHSPRSPWPREGRPAYKKRHGMCMRTSCLEYASPGKTCCPAHLAEIRARTHKWSLANRARGECPTCHNIPEPGYVVCDSCRERGRIWRANQPQT
jgi:hypothetical protein